MRVPAHLEKRSSTGLEGVFFDAALEAPEHDSIMKAVNTGLRYAADSDWELFREVIVSYYVDDDLPLKDVMQLMEKEFGFRSTPKVYKTKMNEWGTQKNLTRAQRDKAVQHVEEYISRHGYAPNVTLNGKPVPIGRLRRRPAGSASNTDDKRSPRRRRQRMSPDGDTIELNELLCPVAASGKVDDPPQSPAPEWVFTIPTDSADIDKILRCTEVFSKHSANSLVVPEEYLWPLTEPSLRRDDCYSDCDISSSKLVAQFWSMVIAALNELEMHNRPAAFAELDKACAVVPSFMQAPPASLFRYLFITLGNERWNQYPEIQHHILSYLSHMAHEALGKHHPVTIALDELRKQSMLSFSAEMVIKIAIQAFEEQLGPTHQETLWFKRPLARILRRQGDADLAETLLQTAKKQCDIANGAHSRSSRICLEGLGQLYMQENRLEDAEAVLVELVRKAESKNNVAAGATCGVDHITLYAKRNLCFLAQARDDELLKEYWWAQEHAMMAKHGIDMEDILAKRSYQEKRLFETGNFKYLTQLKGHVIQMTEGGQNSQCKLASHQHSASGAHWW